MNKGFTLMELMIGVGLFAIVLFGIMLLIGESLALGKFSNHRTVAMNEARRVIEEIRQVADQNDLATVVSTNWATWADTVNALPSETTTVTDLQGNPLQNNVDPLQIRVTVSWTEKGKISAYAVDTMVTKR